MPSSFKPTIPTAGPIVYIAGPFRADTPWGIECNIREAEEWALNVASLGAIPLCPHTMYRFYQDALPDDFWLAAGLQLLSKCDAIYLIPGWENSKGSVAELTEARDRLGIPEFYSPGELESWLIEVTA